MAEKPTYEELEQRVKELEKATEQQTRIDEYLAEDQELFSTVFFLSPIATAITSIENEKIIQVNESFVAFSGYNQDEIIGQSTSALNLWTSDQDREKLLKTLREQNSIHNFNSQVRIASGEIRECLFSAEIIHYNNGPHIISMVIDITDLKRTEEELRESEEKYRMLAENVTDVIWTMDMNLKFLYISPSILQLRGYTVDEAMVQPLACMIVPDSLGEIMTLLTQKLKMIESGHEEGWAPIVFEMEQPCKDGTTVWTLNNAKILQDSEKQPVGIIGVTHNITERKNAEEALRKNQVIIESNIKYFENMNIISESVSQSTEVGEMIKRVIEDVFNIFKADRAWLLYPCDPDSPTFQVPYEHTKPEYPGALESGIDSPIDEGIKQIFEDLLSTEEVITYDLSNESFRTSEPVKKFYMQSQMVIAMHPQTGSPWVLGLHQCSHERIWTSEEQKLFKDISLKVKDALNNLLLFKELFKREQFLNRIIDQSPFATWISDSEGTLQRANPALKRFLNLTDEQLVGKYNVLNDTIAERQGLQPLFRTVFEDGKTIMFSLEWDGNDMPSMDLKGSNSVNIEATMFPIHNSEGKLTNVVLNWIDITERKQAEEALRKSEERLRIQNQIANIFLTKSDEDMYGEILSVVLDIMESKFGVFGYIDEQGDLVCPSMTRDIWDQCQISDKTIVFPENTWGESIWGNGLRTGLSAYSNKLLKVPEGHIPVDRCLTVPIVYQQESVGLFTVANKSTDYTESDKLLLQEIAEQVAPVLMARTEKERSNKALQESEEYHRNLFENSPTALYLQDFSEVEEQVKRFKSTGITDLGMYLRENPEVAFQLSRGVVFSSVNQAAVDLYKANSQDKLLGTLDQVIIKGDSQHFIDQVVAFTNGEDLWEGEASKYNFQKEIIDIVIKKAVINRQANSLSKVLVSINDVTELHKAHENRERLEAQLQQALKMEAMGTLAGGIAHDFNNLLMAIQGRTSIMLTKKESSHPDIRHLKGIEDNVESAADLTRQLLGFARGGKYEVKPTDLNELVKKENRMFGRTKKEIAIRGKYEKDLWSVEVDQGQIAQVLLNLYVNAWQAMPAGGDLYLETENVILDEIDVEPFSIEPGEYVKISVTDTGVGMDKATRERIFEPFFTTKEMGRGTGLGLASVYGIIKNHGGFIDVYSEKGHGTAFNIYLPASEKEIIEEKKSDGDTLRGSETVLFVDDEDMIIEVAEEMFEELGYKVLIARSGKEAIKTYQENKELIDIVLLDMIMPDMSGSDTYDRMKELDPDIKVLLASGYSINGQATEIMDRGCNGFIQKPFKMKELSQKLREILDS